MDRRPAGRAWPPGLADAFGPRVRANAILPGAVLTDIAKAWPADRLRRASEGVPLGRAGQPADLVGTALWLASRASEWVTGTLVRVDGGLYRQIRAGHGPNGC